MEFKDAKFSDVRMKLALAGKSGSGKTLGALMIAKGLVNDMAKVGVAQTESGRAQCYLNKYPGFKVLEMRPPFSPDQFIKAIETAEIAGLKCLIVDSFSDEWAGLGGTLDIHSSASEVTKNSFTAWKKVTPQHEAFMNKVLQANIHIICTIKKKTDYVMEEVERNGRKIQTPKRVGVKDIAREDTEYRWITQLDLDQDGNMAMASKDNSGLFQGKGAFQISEQTGAMIRAWCLNSSEAKREPEQQVSV
jgi:ABC-type dipeptide/oligopeptide/nickel transport system ATPase component